MFTSCFTAICSLFLFLLTTDILQRSLCIERALSLFDIDIYTDSSDHSLSMAVPQFMRQSMGLVPTEPYLFSHDNILQMRAQVDRIIRGSKDYEVLLWNGQWRKVSAAPLGYEYGSNSGLACPSFTDDDYVQRIESYVHQIREPQKAEARRRSL